MADGTWPLVIDYDPVYSGHGMWTEMPVVLSTDDVPPMGKAFPVPPGFFSPYLI